MVGTTQRSITVTVVATVLNEEDCVADLVDSLVAQTRRADEVIISDGGSTDRTVERLRAAADGRLDLQILQLPGANISEGRNAAVLRARSELIAVTDAGVRLKPTWLEQLVTPFERRRCLDVVSGFFEPAPRTVFEIALGATVLPDRKEINPTRFLPSSRSVAFTKAAWSRAGGYPEWLDYCEDVVLDISLRRAGCVFGWAPEAVALFRPRPNLRAFCLQYYRYARGDGKAGLWPRRHAARYASYSAALALALAGRGKPFFLLPLAMAAAIHLWAPYRRLAPHFRRLSLWHGVRAAAWVPVIRLAGDVAKMLGYPAGVVWRLRQR